MNRLFGINREPLLFGYLFPPLTKTVRSGQCGETRMPLSNLVIAITEACGVVMMEFGTWMERGLIPLRNHERVLMPHLTILKLYAFRV